MLKYEKIVRLKGYKMEEVVMWLLEIGERVKESDFEESIPLKRRKLYI
jgi:hypothetical protein